MAFQRTDPNHEEFTSRQSSRCADSGMMDEILALLLQDHSSDEEKKDGATDKPKSKDCGVAGQHCGRKKGDSSHAKSQSPLLSGTRGGGRRCHSVNDISSLMVRQPPPMPMDFASMFRDPPPLAAPRIVVFFAAEKVLEFSSLSLTMCARGFLLRSSPGIDPMPAARRNLTEPGITELNDAEFENLKKRMRTQEASRRYRRRKKDTLRQQKQDIQELRSELARLHSIEADVKVMDQQSPSRVLREFDAHAQELHERLEETRAAAETELAVIRSIQDHLTG